MTEAATPRSDRVNICLTKHETYRQLTEGPRAPFKTMKDLFLAAAAVGVKQKVKTPLEKRVGIFAWSQFSTQEDIPFMYALILSFDEPLETLLDQAKMLDILEEYANAGIEELAPDLMSSTRPSLTLVNMVLMSQEANVPGRH
jgi:dnd system-associated protein 4